MMKEMMMMTEWLNEILAFLVCARQTAMKLRNTEKYTSAVSKASGSARADPTDLYWGPFIFNTLAHGGRGWEVATPSHSV